MSGIGSVIGRQEKAYEQGRPPAAKNAASPLQKGDKFGDWTFLGVAKQSWERGRPDRNRGRRPLERPPVAPGRPARPCGRAQALRVPAS